VSTSQILAREKTLIRNKKKNLKSIRRKEVIMRSNKNEIFFQEN